jgi:DNA-directed RNA polymerase alpha subunit
MSKVLKICSRGHKFYKSSDCPVCPVCWSGCYKNKIQNDFPKLSAPALRALLHAKITSLKHLTKFTEKELLELHGFGPSSLPPLRQTLKKLGLAFRKNK